MDTKRVHAFRADFRQAFRQPFVLAVLGVILCFILDNPHDFGFVVHGDPELLKHSEICVQYFYFHAVSFGGVFCSYLLPIVTAVPYAASYSQEFRHHLLIYQIVRCHKRVYFRNKILVTALSGGLTASLGGLLFMAMLAVKIPLTTPMNLFEMQDFPYAEALASHGGLPYMVIVVYLLFLSGALWSSAGLCISAYLPNPYLAICSPMMFQFFLVELSRLLHLENNQRLDMLLCARGSIISDTFTLPFVTIAVCLLVMGFGIVFTKRCERRLENAS